MIKTVIVTGGASGIGFETALFLVEQNYHALIIDNDEKTFIKMSEKLQKNISRNLYFLKLDLNEWESGNKIMSFCENNKLTVFALLNNVSYRTSKDLADEDLESWESTLSLTLRSAFSVSQSFITKNPYKGKKYIVNIGSVVSNLSSRQSPAYHAAKGGLSSLTKYLAVTAPNYQKEITVNCIELGFIVHKRHLKKFFSKKNRRFQELAVQNLPNNKIGREIDVANLIHFLISGRADFINGAIIPLEGGSILKEHFNFSLQLNEVLYRE